MTQHPKPNQRRTRLANFAGVAFGTVLVIAASVLAPAAHAENDATDKTDLTYPRAGQSAPIIEAGQTNNGQAVTGTSAGDGGHLIIDKLFRQRYATPEVEAQKLNEIDDLESTLPEPAAVSAPKASDEAVTPPAADEKPLGAIETTPDADIGVRGLLYRLSRQGEADSFIFGTIHSEDPRVMALPDQVVQAFQASDVFVPEADIDAASLKGLSADMLFSDGVTMQSIIGAELFASVAARLAAHGIPRTSAARLKPWAAIVVLAAPPRNTGMFLDRTLLESARAAGKNIAALESIDEQIDVFREMSEQDQTTLLNAAVQGHGDMSARTEELTVSWLERDLKGLMAMTRPADDSDGSSADARLRARLIDDRNQTMTERLLPMLGDRTHFVAIGALHLPGPGGMLELLSAAGYRVETVY